MAAKLNRLSSARAREKIRVSMLIKRLSDHADGKVEMSNSQVRAATYLIDQAIGRAPQPLQHSGEDGGPIRVVYDDDDGPS